jgi:glucose-1-phosphate thymidylyltransferase
MVITDAILLTGGNGTRLKRFSKVVANKHLFPIEDKLVIDYSINTIKKLAIKNLTVILGGDYYSQIVDVLQDGAGLGLNINYVLQSSPVGIAQAINLCEPFIKSERFAVVLGDNCFQLPISYNKASNNAEVFLNNSNNIDLHQFGVMSIFNDIIMSIEEKPTILAAGIKHYAITGCYIFNKKYFEYFKNLKMSARGEFEITGIIEQYAKNKELNYSIQPGWWSDMGTLSSIDKVRELLKTEPVEF